MDTIIQYLLTNGKDLALWIIIIGFCFKWIISLDFVQKFIKSKQQISSRQQNQQITLNDNVQRNYFQHTKEILQQNKQFNTFLKQNILNQLSELHSKFDLMQRYINDLRKTQTNCQTKINQMLQKTKYPYLQKPVAKWILQTIMQLHLKKKLQYLSTINNKYKQNTDTKIIINDIYRVFKQITRQQVQLMQNFKCNYGDFSKPLKEILQTSQFDKFIYEEIQPCLKLSKQQMLATAQNIINTYIQQLIKFVDKN